MEGGREGGERERENGTEGRRDGVREREKERKLVGGRGSGRSGAHGFCPREAKQVPYTTIPLTHTDWPERLLEKLRHADARVFVRASAF